MSVHFSACILEKKKVFLKGYRVQWIHPWSRAVKDAGKLKPNVDLEYPHLA